MDTEANDVLREQYDAVVIGGGAAGLSGALALARARRAVLVVDAGDPRNAPADGVHNYLGREGVRPDELLATGRREVAGYGGHLVSSTVVGLRRLVDPPGHLNGGFRVELVDGRTVQARRLLVTTGLVDELPQVPGLAERWGRDVLSCPYCHGWEVRDQAIGILATSPMAAHQALMWRQLSADVALFLHTVDDLPEQQREQMAACGVAVVTGEVGGLEIEDDRLGAVRLRSGHAIPRQALVVAPLLSARAEVLAAVGLLPTELRMGEHVIGTRIEADATGATGVPGVWVAGNVTDPFAQVIVSAGAGLRAGAAINADLIAEETDAAVTARREASHPHPAARHLDPIEVFSAQAEREVSESVMGERRHGLSTRLRPAARPDLDHPRSASELS